MKSAKCFECGFVGWADAEFCKKCGAEVTSPSMNESEQIEQSPPYDYQITPNQFSPDVKQGLAIASLVLGILNFLFLGIFGVTIIIGIVLSVVALKKIKHFPHLYGGHGYAVAGLVTNIVSVVILIPILLIAAIAIPNLLASRRAANEGATINALRQIHSAEATYQSTTGRGAFGTLAELESQNLISSELASGTRWGYRFKIEPVRDNGYGAPGFAAVAVPADYGSTGRRSFFVDETGVIRGADSQGMDATRYDAPLRMESEHPSQRSASRRARQNTEE